MDKQNLRKGIDYIGVGVGVILVDHRGRLFLARRGPEARNERGLWEFPGGSVEFGETLEAAIKREMSEEFGIAIALDELLDVADHILPEEGQHWVSPTYLGRITAGTPQIREPGKCSEICWFFPDQFPADLTVITRQNWQHYLERMKPGAGRPG